MNKAQDQEQESKQINGAEYTRPTAKPDDRARPLPSPKNQGSKQPA